jgi:hypothetical protein
MTNLYDIDVQALRDESQLAQVDQTLDQAQQVNLDEVTIEELEVAFIEYESVEKDGQKHMRPHKRVALISTYVPISLLHKMLAGQKKAQALKVRVDSGELEMEDDPMMLWISRQVFAVWKLSEPDMSWERFERGLDLEKVLGLFSRFFSSTLRKLRGKV